MKMVRIAAIVTLSFLALSAFLGAIPLILDPTGSTMRMPLSFLRYSPFHSFLIPGVILLVSNGLLALVVLWMALRRIPRYGLWTALQGCVLMGWLVVECWILRLVVWPHYLYGAAALALIVTGMALRHEPAPGSGT
ncbi:MAG: hypothetical protein ABSF23_07485 [Terracidiphilus sp.]|jgi:hypothetical protein